MKVVEADMLLQMEYVWLTGEQPRLSSSVPLISDSISFLKQALLSINDKTLKTVLYVARLTIYYKSCYDVTLG